MNGDLELIRSSLRHAADNAHARGMPRIDLRGQLIRPSLAYAAASSSGDVPSRFWNGALAIQLAHEASLVHDDIVDQAKTRRGEPTVAETHGTAKALVYGDHLLTASYRLAAETGSAEFFTLFSQCVERTVAGEIDQAKSLGKILTFAEYKSIAESKSGELLAASLALGAALCNPARVAARAALGRKLGLLYQMLDDLLDYCPAIDTGKPAFGDFRQKRWTWPLLELGTISFDESCDEIARRFRCRDGGATALRRCLAWLDPVAESLKADLSEEFDSSVGHSLIDEWLTRAREAVAREECPRDTLVSRLPVKDDVVSYLGNNSKSFRFASRFFPADQLTDVAHVYSFCRVTDDLVDKNDPSEARDLLTEWMMLARASYNGVESGVAFLDRTMNDMRSHGISFRYAEELAHGMRMDLRSQRYANLSELRVYTYRVASVVGLWLTELAGVRERVALKHAEALGHAMQLTNILRDVGEDARNGRLYLPIDRLAAHGITEDQIIHAANGQRSLPSGFADLIEELIEISEKDYALALPGVRYLPASFQRPVAVAAHLYRGIHSEIRRNRHDTLTRRAVTSNRKKALLAARAIWELKVVSPRMPRSSWPNGKLVST